MNSVRLPQPDTRAIVPTVISVFDFGNAMGFILSEKINGSESSKSEKSLSYPVMNFSKFVRSILRFTLTTDPPFPRCDEPTRTAK